MLKWLCFPLSLVQIWQPASPGWSGIKERPLKAAKPEGWIAGYQLLNSQQLKWEHGANDLTHCPRAIPHHISSTQPLSLLIHRFLGPSAPLSSSFSLLIDLPSLGNSKTLKTCASKPQPQHFLSHWMRIMPKSHFWHVRNKIIWKKLSNTHGNLWLGFRYPGL